MPRLRQPNANGFFSARFLHPLIPLLDPFLVRKAAFLHYKTLALKPGLVRTLASLNKLVYKSYTRAHFLHARVSFKTLFNYHRSIIREQCNFTGKGSTAQTFRFSLNFTAFDHSCQTTLCLFISMACIEKI